MRYLTASLIYSYCIFNNFLYTLSKCPNQWNAHRCIIWYVIDKMVKYPGKLFSRFGMISKLLSTFPPFCHREDISPHLAYNPWCRSNNQPPVSILQMHCTGWIANIQIIDVYFKVWSLTLKVPRHFAKSFRQFVNNVLCSTKVKRYHRNPEKIERNKRNNNAVFLVTQKHARTSASRVMSNWRCYIYMYIYI